ncbi:4a-hydroxytetrahydrobiopterin dehydratase [Synechococcus sp. RedBA-s]|uniref:4a-hydroxytetrahydrobiopterin dehydratase n=1 Tax=Synechococcus sp. RedBA-s TaxID=2823741 RepID=UPI0020CBAA70|nr:4a-hydroxytetrahydrobiopterin dehydratase [Synechococcus sp. RedBA-s]
MCALPRWCPRLEAEELASLQAELPGWEVIEGHHLHKHLSFPDFCAALAWLNHAGAICEDQGHHGDFRVGWGYVEIDIHTHKADGLTRADAVMFERVGVDQSGWDQSESCLVARLGPPTAPTRHGAQASVGGSTPLEPARSGAGRR